MGGVTVSKGKNYDYTAKERKQREREQMKELGFRRMENWVHSEDWEDVKEIIEKKKKCRLNDLTP